MVEEAGRVVLDEAARVAQAQQDPAAFGWIYDQYFARVYSYIRYRVRDPALADDLTATVFLRALDRLGSYDAAIAPFAAWLFAVARHAVSDQLRQERRQRWLSLDVVRDWVSPAPPPDEAAEAHDERARLLAAVARLPARDRDLIGLKFAAGLTNRRIAALTGLSESNVGVILHRAVRRLQTDLSTGLNTGEDAHG
jgi:RNA polymerase sigma-70 factor (ECF subfamily)